MNQTNPPATSFNQLKLSTPLLTTLQSLGYETPTPIQEKTIPVMFAGKDVIAQAQTGTGKTAAFALPLLDKVNLKKGAVQILVLAPTRELANQVAENIVQYGAAMKKLTIACLCGGEDYRRQLKQLKAGAQVVVGTPGRVMDHMRRGSLILSSLTAFVLDEADEMLRMGFIEDVEWILEKLPQTRQMALFSATMPPRIRKIADQYLVDAQHITIASKTATVSQISQRFLFANQTQKNDALLRLLLLEETDGVIVFVRTKQLTEDVCRYLVGQGIRAKAIHGDIAQKHRMAAVDDLRSGAINVLVATDVAARGIDIERISHVINYDIPFDAETYVHRIGRTGRAGRTGNAILFVTPKESRLLNQIERSTKQKITKIQVPSDEALRNLHFTRLQEKLSALLDKSPDAAYVALIDQLMAETGVSAVEIAAMIAAQAFPAPRKQKPAKQAKVEKPCSPDKPERSRQKPKRTARDTLQVLYHLDVGKKHGVKAGNIIGAIANEAGLSGKHINDLTIYDDYSTVALPDGMPKHIFKDLKKTRVCGRQLNLSPAEGIFA